MSDTGAFLDELDIRACELAGSDAPLADLLRECAVRIRELGAENAQAVARRNLLEANVAKWRQWYNEAIDEMRKAEAHWDDL